MAKTSSKKMYWLIPSALIVIIVAVGLMIISVYSLTKTGEPEIAKPTTEYQEQKPECVEGSARTWMKTFGGPGEDTVFSGQQTSDGGYIIAGETGSFSGNGIEDVYLIKTDLYGNVTWEKAFGGNKTDIGYSVQQTSDGGYIVVGYTGFAGQTDLIKARADIYLIKSDTNGNKLWEKTFGGDEVEVGYSVQQTSDGGYIIAGEKGYYADYMYLIKTDKNGNKVWEKTFGGGMGGAYSAQQTSDNGYIVVGNMRYNDKEKGIPIEENYIYLIKTDTNGNV